jgi:hypothetical protein
MPFETRTRTRVVEHAALDDIRVASGCGLGVGSQKREMELEHQPLTVGQVARDIGRSRTTVQRLLKNGYLRRFKGGIAESSFESFLREHPHLVPYAKLAPAQREWLVLNGFPDQTLAVKAPSVRGLLE